MAIYRGFGGAGDATDDVTVNTVATLTNAAAASETAAAASATEAAASASDADASATASASSASSSASSASASATSATAAAASASAANTSAVNAENSNLSAQDANDSALAAAVNAAASETAAAASETAAADSEGAAASFATAAALSESNAATSASNALSSANAASSSAATASNAATTATTAATSASASSTSAAASATAASGSASSALAAATAAAGSESAAATSETNAATSASSAATSATSAAASESAAATSATNAANSASNAALSETNAALSETNAALSETNAASSAAAAAASFDAFDDIYLGAKSANPSVDNDGNPLIIGALYFNTVDSEQRVWNGSTWQAASVIGGTVTNLTITNNPTLSAGTANGVAYLNGSKVLTSGSALTFDGTNLGIGNSNPTEKLEVVNASGAVTAKIWSATNTSPIASLEFQRGTNPTWGADAYGDYRIRNDTGALLFQYGENGTTTERMRLNSSGNLGIGTSSPSSKLEVADFIIGGSDASGATGSIVIRSRETSDSTRTSIGALRSSGASYFGRAVEPSTTVANGFNGGFTTTTGGGAWVIGNSGETYFTSFPSAAMTKGSALSMQERMRIDSSGNLGLGVTPSASGSGYVSLEVGSGLGLQSNSGYYARLFQNAYYNGTNYIYRTTNGASRYQMSSGQHEWYTAPSGTAGTAITFTQAMTLEGGGNLLIGGTSTTTPISLDKGVYLQSSTDGAAIGYSLFVNDGGVNSRRVSFFLDDTSGEFGMASTYNSGAPTFVVKTGGNTTRFSIDGSGDIFATTGNMWFPTYNATGRGIYWGDSSLGTVAYIKSQTNTGDGNLYIGSDDVISFRESDADTEKVNWSMNGGLYTFTGDMHITNDLSAQNQVLVGYNAVTNTYLTDAATSINAYATTDGTTATRCYVTMTARSGAVDGDYSAIHFEDYDGTSVQSKFKVSYTGAAWVWDSVFAGRCQNNSSSPTTTYKSGEFNFTAYAGASTSYTYISGRNVADTSAVVYAYVAGAAKFYATAAGAAYAASWNTISDRNYKQDIVDATSQIADMKALTWRKYRMKDEVALNGDAATVQLGLIAQEAMLVCPKLVREEKVRDEQGKETDEFSHYSLNHTALFMKTAAALTEALHKIDELEARIAVLEAK